MSLNDARERPSRRDQGESAASNLADDGWTADQENLREVCELRESEARKKAAARAEAKRKERWKEAWEQ